MAKHSIEPHFEIGEKGRVICQDHDKYFHFIDPNKSYFDEQFLDVELTCKSCHHYINDECYFSKSRIDKIARKLRCYKCHFCGRKIERMFSVMQKLYYQEKYNVQLALICCSCCESFARGNFSQESKRKIYSYSILFFFNIYSVWIVYFILMLFGINLFLLISYLVPILYINCILFDRVKNLIFGIKYAKKLE